MREKLEEAWERAYPDCRIAWMRNRFTRLLDAEAWLDAAMMLVPDGWGWSVERERPTRDCMASVSPPGTEPFGPGAYIVEEADTPAEALLAAIEKART
jgi:hypothetical protein